MLAAAFVQPNPAGAAPRTAPFRLGPGHASRPAFYFVLTTPGTVRVRVDTSRDEPVSVTLYGGTAAVHHEQGQGQIAFTVTATRDQMAAGSEWAVIVTGNRTGTTGQGTITVDAPEPSEPQAGPLDTWLHRHPAVAFHLTWNDGERSHSCTLAWPAEMRAALGAAVEAARAGRFSQADDPPANAWKRASDDPDAVHTAFAPEAARALYIATVAHSLAVELD